MPGIPLTLIHSGVHHARDTRSFTVPIEKKQDECGVIAVQGREGDIRVANDLFVGLLSLQHRGQESAGMATFTDGKIHVRRGMGLATDVFDESEIERIPGRIGIGHVRYSTTGSSVIDNAQPLLVHTRAGEIAIALNGNLVNYASLREELEQKGHAFTTSTDTECLAYLLEEELVKGKSFMEAAKTVMPRLDGAYCFVVLTSKGDILVMRDEKGFRPLCMGERESDGARVIASETAALDALGARFVRSVEPGEVLFLDGEYRSEIAVPSTRHAHCMFEWVYISRPDSVVEGESVIAVREKLGEMLSRLYPEVVKHVDLVVPIPDSGRSAAYGFSRATGIRIAEALQKNRYVHRTFIMPGSERRKLMVGLKLNIVKSLVEGKRIALVDDSIVRSTTARRIVSRLREAGAKEVHLLVSCPPIKAPCFMGVDFPTYDELIAHKKDVEGIRKEIGADSLSYMTIEGLVTCVGKPAESLCLACLNEEYPTKTKPNMNTAGACC